MTGEQLGEPLVLRSLETTAYLKLPRAFKERFRINSESIKEPTAFLEQENGEIRLTYVWKEQDLERKKHD